MDAKQRQWPVEGNYGGISFQTEEKGAIVVVETFKQRFHGEQSWDIWKEVQVEKKDLFLKQFSKSIRDSARWKCVIQVMNWFWAFVLVTVEQNKSYKHHFWLMSLGSYLIDIFSKCNLYRTTHELGSYLASDAYVSYDPWTWQLFN